MSNRTEKQFGVLAFDLGEIGPNSHPPQVKSYTQITHNISDSGPSGPWIIQTNYWRPVWSLSETPEGYNRLDRHGDYIPESFGSRENIHSEKWLMGGLNGYLETYHKAHRRMPLSVNLYSYMAPCGRCVEYLKRFPGGKHAIRDSDATVSIGRWYIGYSANYDREYPDIRAADVVVGELGKHGWTVIKRV
jgi:hypothetical protein